MEPSTRHRNLSVNTDDSSNTRTNSQLESQDSRSTSPTSFVTHFTDSQDLRKRNFRILEHKDTLTPATSASGLTEEQMLKAANNEKRAKVGSMVGNGVNGKIGSDIKKRKSEAPSSEPQTILSPFPPSSILSSRLPPTYSYDFFPDFIPDPSNPHSLKHSEFGYEGFDIDGQPVTSPERLKEFQSMRRVSIHHSHPNYSTYYPNAPKRPQKVQKSLEEMEDSEASYLTLFRTYLVYAVLIIFGHLRDFFGKRFYPKSYKHLMDHDGYASLLSDFESFYTRRLKARIEYCFARPVTSVPGRTITLLTRIPIPTIPSARSLNPYSIKSWISFFGVGGNGGDGRAEWRYPVQKWEGDLSELGLGTEGESEEEEVLLKGETLQALNISSYNYLGFAQSRGFCADYVEQTITGTNSLSSSPTPVHPAYTGGSRLQVGTHISHIICDKLIAQFLGTEDAMVFSQGFATNSTSIPGFLGKGDLIISDELNHASLRFGSRLSGAMVRIFSHNSMKSLEKVLRESISEGQPPPPGKSARIWRPWNRVIVMVEGIYSMEGTVVDLPKVLELKRKYKFYLYLDEAHSIGGLGPRGRGVCDYFGVDPREVDMLMGTLTKSFGASGGYIGGSAETIGALRKLSHSYHYAEAPTVAVTAQIVASLALIMNTSQAIPKEIVPNLPKGLVESSEGKERLTRLSFNARFLSGGLRKLGFICFGSRDSPIIPLLIYSPAAMANFSRLILERHRIAVVIVAYPATPIVSGRARFCVSASHTFADIARILIACDDVGELLGLKLSTKVTGKKRWTVQQVIERWSEVVEDFEDDD